MEEKKRVPKLLQISLVSCPPCRKAKSEIMKTFSEDITDKFYEYVDEVSLPKRFDELTKKYKVMGVPRFIIETEDGDFLHDIGSDRYAALEFLKDVEAVITPTKD
jgi:thioredoxin-related protein